MAQWVTKEDLNYAAQVQKRTFAKKEDGKSLVANAEIEKLAGVAEGAQVNTIETVKVNGVALEATGKAVDITVMTDEQVQQKINAAVSSAYKAQGSATLETLPAADAVQVGHVYDMSEVFVTTDAFREGAGKEYPAGTNVVWTEDGKWDCLAGIVDTSGFVKTSDIGEITDEEIEAMYADTE